MSNLQGFSLIEILFCLLLLSSVSLVLLYEEWQVIHTRNQIFQQLKKLKDIDGNLEANIS